MLDLSVCLERMHQDGRQPPIRAQRLDDLALVLLAHPTTHHALQAHSALFADTAFWWRCAELTGEAQVVRFNPRRISLAVLAPIDAYTGCRPMGAGRCEARELAAVCSRVPTPRRGGSCPRGPKRGHRFGPP